MLVIEVAGEQNFGTAAQTSLSPLLTQRSQAQLKSPVITQDAVGNAVESAVDKLETAILSRSAGSGTTDAYPEF